ncbi:hypothetical protein HETIRDRAFT_433369 [Heterobasidion irregulare TC 32-1]|uniref:Uncharacterized protein n=1 Tax=Heterobasidion irregulare (strain TC 32-1) TaxID=747525 RepID=W4KGZ7_HETIT|nr:uncharacterized protein HETIRDRAFT_433369 [Heterobasidion irregulare TC 32-1]ETW84600.1 hypothetical protein HETIRDRAFT_433369 [Heterobasidion irregulare TC 32-1]
MRCLVIFALGIAAAVSALPIQSGSQARSEDVTTLSHNTPITERRGNHEGDDKPAELFHFPDIGNPIAPFVNGFDGDTVDIPGVFLKP